MASADYDDGYIMWVNGEEGLPLARDGAGRFRRGNDPADPHESSNGAVPDYGAPNNVSSAALAALDDGWTERRGHRSMELRFSFPRTWFWFRA